MGLYPKGMLRASEKHSAMTAAAVVIAVRTGLNNDGTISGPRGRF